MTQLRSSRTRRRRAGVSRRFVWRSRCRTHPALASLPLVAEGPEARAVARCATACRRALPERRGLSTLEMVLCLPLLLMVMAVMINFGVAACWKVRCCATVSRHLLWNTRWPRTGTTDPRPPHWPLDARAGRLPDEELPALDDLRVNHPVVRGPLPGGNRANADLLDPARGLRRAEAEINRAFPILPKVGRNHVDAYTRLLDDKWQYQRFGLPGNTYRRIPVIYSLAQAPRALVTAYVNGVVGLLQAPFRADLAPLDRDEEFLAWERHAPDFHPRLVRFCELDREAADRSVDRLVERIRGTEQRDSQGRLIRRVPSLAEGMASPPSRPRSARWNNSAIACEVGIRAARREIRSEPDPWPLGPSDIADMRASGGVRWCSVPRRKIR